MVKQRKRYDASFKLRAVQLVEEQGRKIGEVARDLGVRVDALARWRREYRKSSVVALPGNERESLVVQGENTCELAKKLLDVEMEQDVIFPYSSDKSGGIVSGRKWEMPEGKMPIFCQKDEDLAFLKVLIQMFRTGDASSTACASLDALFSSSSFPQRFRRLIVVAYAPGHKRILVSREDSLHQLSFSVVFKRLIAHPRRTLDFIRNFRLQLDFVVEPPAPVDLFAVGMSQLGARHFEIGLDGLMFRDSDGKLQIFLPGDAYVRSIMGMGQLREFLSLGKGVDFLRQFIFERFRSESFLSSEKGWLRLYRGYPLVGALTKEKLENAVDLAIGHIRRNQEENGKFLYYYDAALDSRRDHEHPGRDPINNPFYNILRHGGGGLTCIFYEKYKGKGESLENIRLAIEYLIAHTGYQEYGGRQGGYIYSEKKAKLGGSGIALYLAAEYQLLTGDQTYKPWAEALAWHLTNQITESGEFIYYNIYLDQPISEEENQKYFSFYYPGEAVCGLAKFLHLLDQQERQEYFVKLQSALEFLLFVRPKTRAGEYTAVPSDSWLMMGIMELWDFPEMRKPAYADFVFTDAEKMIAHMYTVDDAPYPDYAGAFYYRYGDYPYADGARCEGLLGAYQLALKMGDEQRAAQIWAAMRLAAWALMHLVNTEDAVYFAKNPQLALGGIRFKYTRQWFRIDTIQHVASFFAKMLPHWDRAS